MSHEGYSLTPHETASRPDREADRFWATYQPGFRFSDRTPGDRDFFREVERHRYTLEPHICELADFGRWRGLQMLEVGCGIGTDGVQFSRHGARYTGLDLSPTAVELARRRFALEGLRAKIEQGSATALPFADESFDHVYSHGVIHHIEDTDSAVGEMYRVLRPGGTALVMVYHRGSLNYYVNTMLIRRALAATLLLPGAPKLVSRLTGENESILQGHRDLLRQHGSRYVRDTGLFLSNNTDGPGNPLSKVYARSEARKLFRRFSRVATRVRYLNLRLLPGGSRVEATSLGQAMGHRLGWHLYVLARK